MGKAPSKKRVEVMLETIGSLSRKLEEFRDKDHRRMVVLRKRLEHRITLLQKAASPGQIDVVLAHAEGRWTIYNDHISFCILTADGTGPDHTKDSLHRLEYEELRTANKLWPQFIALIHQKIQEAIKLAQVLEQLHLNQEDQE